MERDERMMLMCSPCGWVERDHKPHGEPFFVDGAWWQAWMCLLCGRRQAVVRPQVPGAQTAVR